MPQFIPQGYPLFMARIGKDAPVPEVRADVRISLVVGWDAQGYAETGTLKPIITTPYGAPGDYAEPYSALNDDFVFAAIGFGATPEQAEESARESFKQALPGFQAEFKESCAEKD